MRKIVFTALAAIILTACGIPSRTAESINDIRWEVTTAAPTVEAQLLECSWVVECRDWNLGLEAHYLIESKREIYVWAYPYFSTGLLNDSTVLYIVVNRPGENTWDKLGLEYIDGQWQVGVYEGGWDYVPASYDPKNDQVITIGMAGEQWAVIVRPTSAITFQYSVEEFYWK